MKVKLLQLIAFCMSVSVSVGQTPDSLKTTYSNEKSAPIPIELFIGNRAFAFQLIVSKQFSPRSRLGFFNVTSYTGNYKEVNQASDFLSQSFLTAEVWRGISVAAGLSAIGSSGSPMTVRPTIGLQYLLANHNFVIVVLPRFDLIATYNFETFAVLEFKPMLSKNWGIYTRLQGLFNYNTKLGFQEISSVYMRLGVSYKNVQFGLGTNQDYYGPENRNVSNMGLFIKTDLY